MLSEMNSEQSTSSKEIKADEKDNSKGDKSSAPVVDYAATGARPKVFPVPDFATANRREFDDDESAVDAWGGRSLDEAYNYAVGNEDKENQPDECSTVEITVEDESQSAEGVGVSRSQEEIDEAYARSLQWQDVNDDGADFGSQWREPLWSDANERAEAGAGSTFGGDGFEDLAKEFPASGAKEGSESGDRAKCAYCKRSYDYSFIETHRNQCIENPDVAAERREVKHAVEASAIDAWRSVPNPVTQNEWRPVAVQNPYGATGFGSTEFDSFPIGVWGTGSKTDVGGDEAAAAASASSGYDDGFQRDPSDNVMIPCEFCFDLIPAYALYQHQTNCQSRS